MKRIINSLLVLAITFIIGINVVSAKSITITELRSQIENGDTAKSIEGGIRTTFENNVLKLIMDNKGTDYIVEFNYNPTTKVLTGEKDYTFNYAEDTNAGLLAISDAIMLTIPLNEYVEALNVGDYLSAVSNATEEEKQALGYTVDKFSIDKEGFVISDEGTVENERFHLVVAFALDDRVYNTIVDMYNKLMTMRNGTTPTEPVTQPTTPAPTIANPKTGDLPSYSIYVLLICVSIYGLYSVRRNHRAM